MDYQQSIDSAKSALEEGRYSEAGDICLSLINNDFQSPEVSTISAISLLNGFSFPLSENNKGALLNCLARGAESAKTAEEAKKMEYDFAEAFYNWVIKKVEALLKRLEVNPVADNYMPIFDADAGMFMLNVMFTVSGNEHVKALREQLTETEQNELNEKYGSGALAFGDPIHSPEVRTMEYETGCRLFEKAESLVNRYAHTDNATMASGVPDINNHYLFAELLVDLSIPPERDKDGKEVEYPLEEQASICTGLKKNAEILSSELNAVLYPHGERLSLSFDYGRSSKLKELRDTYSRLQKLDPDFKIPPMPREEGYKLKNSGTNNSSGGCYVATAVYGSYDCPEVWTLRRYRDNTLAESWYGRAFIHTYYAVSPSLVKWFGDTDWFRNMWKPKLDKMVQKLNKAGISGAPYQDRSW